MKPSEKEGFWGFFFFFEEKNNSFIFAKETGKQHDSTSRTVTLFPGESGEVL